MEDTGGGYGCREDPSVERMNITPEHIASWLGMVEPNNSVTESSQNLITVSLDQLAEMCNSIHKLKGLPCGLNDMNQLRRSSDGSHSSSSSRNSYGPPHLRQNDQGDAMQLETNHRPRYSIEKEDWKAKKEPPPTGSWAQKLFNRNGCNMDLDTVATTTNTRFNKDYLNTGNRPQFPIILTSKNLYVLDTNVVLHERHNVAKCMDVFKIKCGHQLLLPTAVQRELDTKKEEMNTQAGYLARQAGHDIDTYSKVKNQDQVPLLRIQRSWETIHQLPSAEHTETSWRNNGGWTEAHTKTPLGYNDGSIMLCALFFVRYNHRVTLVTNDTNLRVWARGYGIEAACMKDVTARLCCV